MELSGRRALVTGASSGIGREIALQLAQRGAQVVITARGRDALEEVARECGAQVFTADLSVRGAAADLAAQVGPVDILVNNAGAGVAAPVAAIGDDELARQAFELDYWSPLALIHALRPVAVVNVTSLAYATPWPLSGGYGAAKAALSAATEVLRMESPGSLVVEVIPGPVDTPTAAEVRLFPGSARVLDRVPMGSAQGCARRVVKALERDRNEVMYPRIYRLALMFPTIGRRFLRLLARSVRVDDDVVVQTGSQGDERATGTRVVAPPALTDRFPRRPGACGQAWLSTSGDSDGSLRRPLSGGSSHGGQHDTAGHRTTRRAAWA